MSISKNGIGVRGAEVFGRMEDIGKASGGAQTFPGASIVRYRIFSNNRINAALAQKVERFHGKEEVVGSNPISGLLVKQAPPSGQQLTGVLYLGVAWETPDASTALWHVRRVGGEGKCGEIMRVKRQWCG